MATITGRLTINESHYLEVSTDPSGGTVAPTGSLASVVDGSGLYLKTGAGDTAWTVMASGSLSGSGTSGQVAYWSGTDTVSGDTNFTWDSANDRLGISKSSPDYPIHVSGGAASGSYIGVTPTSPSSAEKHFYSSATVTGTAYPLYFTGSASAGSIVLVTNNSSNAGGLAGLYLTASNALGGDALIRYYAGSTYWCSGADSSDSGKYKISNSTVLGANDYFTIDSGHVGINQSSPLHPIHVSGTASSGNYVAVIPTSPAATENLFYSSATVTGTIYPFYFTGSATTGAIVSIVNSSADANGKAGLNLTSSGGDAVIRYYTGSEYWSSGIDKSDADKYKISQNSVLGTADRIVINTSGDVGINNPSPTEPLSILATNAANILLESDTIALNAFIGFVEFGANSGTNTSARIQGAFDTSAGDAGIHFYAGAGGTAAVQIAGINDAGLYVGARSELGGGTTQKAFTICESSGVTPAMSFLRSDSGVTSGEVLGQIGFGSDDYSGSYIQAYGTGTWGSGNNVYPTAIRFLLQDSTTTDILKTSLPSVTILPNGKVGIGEDASATDWGIEINSGAFGGSSYQSNGILLNASDTFSNSECVIAWQMQGPGGMGTTRWMTGMNENSILGWYRSASAPNTNSLVMGLDTTKPTTGVATNIDDTYLHLKADDYVGLYLEADIDNTNGETSPYIRMLSDGGIVSYYLGGIGSSGSTDIGTLTGVDDNALYVGTTSAYSMHLGTNSVARLTIASDGTMSGLQVPFAWAKIVVTNGTATISESFGISGVSTNSNYLIVTPSVTRTNSTFSAMITGGSEDRGYYLATRSTASASFSWFYVTTATTIRAWSVHPSSSVYVLMYDED